MLQPEFYDAILILSKKVPITVLMYGIPSTGKSTISGMLKKDLEAQNTTCEIFSTDKYFEDENGVYCFDRQRLEANHKLNLNAFRLSEAKVRIVDNTNLSSKDYEPYRLDAVSNGNVVIMLSTKLDSLSVLVNRSKHSIPLKTLDQMKKRYYPPIPIYLGLFPDPQDVEDVLKEQSSLISQKSPLHITVKYIGYKKDVYLRLKKGEFKYGTEYLVDAVGISHNEHGDALIIDSKDFIEKTNPLHITLGTFGDRKPVQVGQAITKENTIFFESKRTLRCILAPMF